MAFFYVALDYDTQGENYQFAKSLADEVQSDKYGFKVNLDSIADFSEGAKNPRGFLEDVVSLGKPVFLDMKMWNGGRTMSNIAKGASGIGVDIINMYPHAGGRFMEKVAKSLEGETKLFGLTVLTHYTNEDTQWLYGLDLPDAVRMLSIMNYENGADGIVVPPTQLDTVNDIPLLKLCPGIRPSWYNNQKDNSQEQIATPSNAVNNGANYLVVGSPIRKACNPVDALESILQNPF